MTGLYRCACAHATAQPWPIGYNLTLSLKPSPYPTPCDLGLILGPLDGWFFTVGVGVRIRVRVRVKNQPDLSLTVGGIFLRFRVRSGYRTRQPGYNLRQRMTQQGIPSPFPDAVGYYWDVDQSTAFGFTLRKTEYPAICRGSAWVYPVVSFSFFSCVADRQLIRKCFSYK